MVQPAQVGACLLLLKRCNGRAPSTWHPFSSAAGCRAEKKQFEESSHYIPSSNPPGERGSKQSLFVSGQLEARSSEQTRDKTSVNSKSGESFRRHKRSWVWAVVGRAQCSGIWRGMVTGLGTQRRVFSAQISPAALYPGICPQLWPVKPNLIC